jgi:hypothetical protein
LISLTCLALGCASSKAYESGANPPPITRPKVARIAPGAVIELKDGSVYRIKGLEQPADARMASVLAARLKRELKEIDVWGLRPVGRRSTGLEEAEIWSYPRPLLLCGNTTKDELRRMQRYWYDVTPMVLQALSVHDRVRPLTKAD